MQKKCRKVASTTLPEAAQRPKLLPGAPKMPPKSTPERVRKVFRSRFRMKTAKCHETLLFTIQKPYLRTSENHFFRRFSGPKRYGKALRQKMLIQLLKITDKSALEAHNAAQRWPPGSPRLPSPGSQNGVQNRSEFCESLVWGCTGPPWL